MLEEQNHVKLSSIFRMTIPFSALVALYHPTAQDPSARVYTVLLRIVCFEDGH